MYFHPSIIAHTLNGAFFLVAVILSLVYYKSLANLDSYRFILLILAFGIIVGIHGLSHLGLEYAYGYNPWLAQQTGAKPRQIPMTCPCMKSCPCHRQMRSEGMQGHPPNCPRCPCLRYCPYRRQMQTNEGFQMKPEGGPTCAIRGDD
jgi:hypothetical protein